MQSATEHTKTERSASDPGESDPANSNQGTRYPLQFTGKGWQYFKIWIVNILLTILTLYIYSAWAKVRTKRYFYGNTVLDNSSFEYHAKGSQIILGRIISVILLIGVSLSSVSPVLSVIATVLLILLLPWAVWRSIKFNARMSSYRNIRFNYQGKLLPIYGMFLVLPFLPLIVFGLLAALAYFLGNTNLGAGLFIFGVFASYLFSPWIHKISQNHIINRYRYGVAEFGTTLSTRKFYAAYIIAFLIWVLMMILAIVLMVLIAMLTGLISEGTLDQLKGMIDETGDTLPLADFWVMGVTAYLLLFVIGFLSIAYLNSKIRRHTFSRTSIDGKVQLESTVSTWPLFWIMFSNAILVLLTLGFAYPWTKIRMARYMAKNTALYSVEPLDNYINAEKGKISALGEEFGDAFDMDVDMGF